MALIDDPYTISPPRTGDARIHRLALTGWSDKLSTWTEDGRVYWTVTTGNALDLYRSPAKASGDKLATGSISSGLVTLVQANASGISGTARVAYTAGVESTGEIIISYANESDLERVLHSSTSLLSSATWAGQTRFEGAFQQGKAEVDRRLPSKLGKLITLKSSTGELDLSVVAKPRQLAEAHARFTAAALLDRIASIAMGAGYREEATYQFRAGERVFGQTRVEVDQDLSGGLEGAESGGSIKLVRG